MWGEAGPHPAPGVYGPEISRENQFSVSEIDTKEEEVDARLLLHENITFNPPSVVLSFIRPLVILMC